MLLFSIRLKEPTVGSCLQTILRTFSKIFLLLPPQSAHCILRLRGQNLLIAFSDCGNLFVNSQTSWAAKFAHFIRKLRRKAAAICS
uniref:Uncharacterized protein n=1 Tax=Tupiella akineta TaxID=160070 RepID=Q6UVU1_TUPAK|nr:hypothetical protein PsakpMp21 [Tupiella akineta]AAQ18733.1 hypothetical protein [Tupiella akineta]